MNVQAIRAQLPKLVEGHVPSNARRFSFQIINSQPQASGLGFFVDPKPFEGMVIAKTDEAIVVKTGRTEFAVLDRSLVTFDPEPDTKVSVVPYARRRFDGRRADTPEEETCSLGNGVTYTVQRTLFGNATAKLPIPTPACPELVEMIEQLEQLPAPDRFRHITHMLVDANAHDFTWVDPKPEDILTTPPAVGFAVKTDKFEGKVAVLFDRALDLYAVELRRDDDLVTRVDQIPFDSLGQVLEQLIDDGTWRRIRVECLMTAKSPRQ